MKCLGYTARSCTIQNTLVPVVSVLWNFGRDMKRGVRRAVEFFLTREYVTHMMGAFTVFT